MQFRISPYSASIIPPRCLEFYSINNGSTNQLLNITESYVRSAAEIIPTTASTEAAINFTLQFPTPETYSVKSNFSLQLLQLHKFFKPKRRRLLNNYQTQFSCDVDSDAVICRSFKSSSSINQHTNVSYITFKSNISILLILDFEMKHIDNNS